MIVALVVFFVTFYVLYPIYKVYRYVRPPRFFLPGPPPSDDGLDYDQVTFVSRDGLKLSGWYVPSQNGAAVILVHGYGGNRTAMLFHARALAQQGCGTLLYDMRAHGRSEGRLFAAGWDAKEDVLGALDFLRGRPDVHSGRIGALGVSVGGQVVLQAAGQTDAICAVVADGVSPTTLQDVQPLHNPIEWFYLPSRWMSEQAVTWLTGVASPPPLTELIPRIAPRPLLLISTGRRTEQRLVRKFFDAAQEPKTLWEIPEAHHADGWHARPEAYAEKIAGFFDETLR